MHVYLKITAITKIIVGRMLLNLGHVDHSAMLGMSKPATKIAQGLPKTTTSYPCQLTYKTNSIGGWG